MASRTAPGGQAREAPRRRAASWLVVTLLLLVAGLAYTVGAASYQVGTLASPGPGLFPVALGMLIVLACGVRLVAECVRPSPPPLPLGPEWWRVPAIGAAILAFTAMLEPAGYVPASAVLCGLLLSVLGRRPWWAIIGFAVVTAVLSYCLFSFLGVPLPPGPLPFY